MSSAADIEEPAADIAIRFTVPGTPRAQPRARHIPTAGGGTRIVSTADPKAARWRQAVSQECKRAARVFRGAFGDGPVSLEVQFRFASERVDLYPPGSRHVGKPDLDNLLKLVMDVMTREGLLPGGDQRVAHVEASKVWWPRAELHVLLRPLEVKEKPACEGGLDQAPEWLAG